MREKLDRETVGKGGSPRVEGGRKNGFFHHLDKVTTSYFITNFPPDATSEDLWKLFLKFGRVAEVYIPKKLDKRGRRFGFVKFKEVREEDVLGEMLRDVWMGSFKLWVNRSRFGRSDSKDTQASKSQQKDDQEVVTTNGKSFKDVLLRGGFASEVSVMKVLVNETFCKELQGSVVGLLKGEKEVRRIQTTLFMEGFQSIKVTSMGGDMVLLRSPMEGDIQRLLRSKNECLHYYFSEIKPWNPGLFAVQREIWIQVYGIPLHIWGDDLFKMIGNKLGAFLDYDEETASMARLDVARLKIRIGKWAVLDEVVKVEVEGVIFSLWVVEERGRQRYGVVFGGEVEDEGSMVVPSEGLNEVVDAPGTGEPISDEDEQSGEELGGDVRLILQHGDVHEVNSDRSSPV
jgi:hypothetical protein